MKGIERGRFDTARRRRRGGLGRRQTDRSDGGLRWRGSYGFTLIEILVVITIISILMGLALVGINAARGRGDVAAVRAELQSFRAAAQQFRQEMGDFPPSQLHDVGSELIGNGLNDGNESLFLFLMSRRLGEPLFEPREDRWVNTDSDTFTGTQLPKVQKEVQPVHSTEKRLEYSDLWGNPFVYIHNRDYGSSFDYMTSEGEVFTVQAQKNPQTGTFYAPTSFQLWSLGGDGINQNGGGDDIVSWE